MVSFYWSYVYCLIILIIREGLDEWIWRSSYPWGLWLYVPIVSSAQCTHGQGSSSDVTHGQRRWAILQIQKNSIPEVKLSSGNDRVVPMHSFKFVAELQHSVPWSNLFRFPFYALFWQIYFSIKYTACKWGFIAQSLGPMPVVNQRPISIVSAIQPWFSSVPRNPWSLFPSVQGGFVLLVT